MDLWDFQWIVMQDLHIWFCDRQHLKLVQGHGHFSLCTYKNTKDTKPLFAVENQLERLRCMSSAAVRILFSAQVQ